MIDHPPAAPWRHHPAGGVSPRNSPAVRRIIAIIPTVMLLCGISARAPSQEAAPRKWLTGDALTRQLESSFGIAWSSEPLRQKLQKLSEHTQIAVWLDRRIDPSQQPELAIAETELSRCYEQISEYLDAGMCYVGPVVYLGPKTVAAKLATVAELRSMEAAELPAEARARLTRRQAWSWESLTTPRELLAELASEAQITFVDADQIQHDLWAAGELPPLTFADRLSLLLAGFDLTFSIDASGKSIRFVPLPDQPKLVRGYPVRGDVNQMLAKLQSEVSTAELKLDGARIVAVARSEDHRAIARILAGQPAPVPAAAAGRKVYSMKGPSVLGTVLKTLQVQVGLNISLDAQAQNKLRDRINFDVKEASLDELLTAVLRDTGLKYELDGKNLKVFGDP